MELSKIQLELLENCVNEKLDRFTYEDIKAFTLLYSHLHILLSDIKREISKL